MEKIDDLKKVAAYIRYLILSATTEAGSGHPTSSLSATDLMATLFFSGYFKYDIKNTANPNNDRLIFSKGHASPLFYALWVAAGAITEEEMMSLRKFGSRLEGHPTMEFPFTEVPTGSLGQGLSVGFGMGINGKYLDKLPYKTVVLLGDSEMAEGSIWETIQLAYHYRLNNLIGIIDVNRLGQRGETMYGNDIGEYQKRIASFGWKTFLIEDGHNYQKIIDCFNDVFALENGTQPIMIIARTVKGKGVSFLEDKDGWHGKTLSQEQLVMALKELGNIERNMKLSLEKPTEMSLAKKIHKNLELNTVYQIGELIATRKAYGNVIKKIVEKEDNVIVLDAEVSNSTYSDTVKKNNSEKFFEMYIAEQNMVGAAMGLSRRDKIPFISTFATFFTRAFDQIRMSGYAGSNIKYIGSHAGVSIGEDGSSQMGLEDISMFRSVFGSVVLYPSDAVSAERLALEALYHKGIVYIRTTRKETPVVYSKEEKFPIGGSKVHCELNTPDVVIIGAGVTFHEAMKASKELKNNNIKTAVIDCYSIKPIDEKTIRAYAKKVKGIIVVEDHYEEGGIFEAVNGALSDSLISVHSLSVRKMPRSGKPDELLDYEEISSKAIVKKAISILI